VLQRVEERHRADQVRREPLQQQRPLRQRLGHQPEVEHLEVAQAAVDELAGPARRAARPVALLDQSGAEAARDGVERRARCRPTATTDDEHVELGPRRHGLERRLADDGERAPDCTATAFCRGIGDQTTLL
jgi:hypothetical protein